MKIEQTHIRKFLLVAGGAVLIALVFVLCAGAWFYMGSPSETKERFAAAVGIPLGKVGGRYVGADEVMAWSTAATKTTLPEGYSLSESLSLRAVADGKVGVSSGDIVLAKQALAQDAEYIKYSQAVGPDVAARTVLTDFVLAYKLRQWYAQHPELEPNFQKQIEQVKTAFTKGQDFNTVATLYSADLATKYFSGDLGYIDVSEAVPEYAEAVEKLEKNKLTVVYTRYGVHFVELLDTVLNGQKTMVKLREVVVEPQQFETWFASEVSKQKTTWYYGRT